MKQSVSEALNYKNFNDDIEKIILTDEAGRVRFSTDNADYKRKEIYPYIKKSLEQQKEQLDYYDFSEKIVPGTASKNRKPPEGNYVKKFLNIFSKDDNEANSISLRAITYPIFLHKGNVIELLEDFKNNYKKYHESDTAARNKIYNYLWKKYESTLGNDFQTGS